MSVSASALGQYHHFSCQLALWKSCYEKPGPSKPSGIFKPTTKAVLKRGRDWENKLIHQLKEQNLILVFDPQTSFRDQIDDDPRSHFYVIGAVFTSPDVFSYEYQKRGVTPVKVGTIKPDFIEIWKRRENDRTIIEWHIIDAKASTSPKISQQAQVFLYWRFLQEILLYPFKATSVASIWLMNEPAPTPFSPPILKPQMDTFLFSTLPKILSLPEEQIPWHYNALCDTCAWRDTCAKRAEDEKTLSMIPDLTIEEAGFLREVLDIAGTHAMTEIEELDSLVRGGLPLLEKAYPSTAKRFKGVLGVNQFPIISPVLEAVKTRTVQILGKPTFHLPRSEDCAIIISLVIDPESTSAAPTLLAFGIAIFKHGKLDEHKTHQTNEDAANQLIECLASTITAVSKLQLTAQIYCFSATEVSALNQIIVHQSLSDCSSPEQSEAVRICIGAVVDLPLVLMSSTQPELLDNSLHRSWGKARRKQLEEHLQDLNLDSRGTVANLRNRLELAMTPATSLRRLPKVVCIWQAMGDLVGMPGPGYTTLNDCARYLLGVYSIPSEDDLYSYAKAKDEYLRTALQSRGFASFRVINALRHLVATESDRILVNDSTPLHSAYPLYCHDLNLRKLVFMHEYEVLLNLKELWAVRADQFKPSPLLEFITFEGWNAQFKVIEGTTDIELPDMKLFDWMICPIDPPTDGTRPELLFDDLDYFNTFFPVARAKWEVQSKSVLSNLALAHPTEISSRSDENPTVTLELYRSSSFRMAPGQRFRLLRRFVDFNLPKILRNILEIDVESRQGPMTIVQELLTNPAEIGQKVIGNAQDAKEETRIFALYRQLRDLGNEDAGQLVFQRSQHRAMQSILKRRLTIIHGPPGTGKTHTLALSMLYLLEILSTKSTKNVMIWMTAVTNAAIDMFVRKLEFLRDRIRAIPNLPCHWLDNLSVLRISSQNKPLPFATRFTIAAGTVWQLWNWNEKFKTNADVVIIDEAGQMNVGTAALAIRWLDLNGRLVVAGDHLQLAPILKGSYPRSECELFGSILHCLVRGSERSMPLDDISISSSQSDIFFQLEENFRMNSQLCNFVELIYQKRFQPMPVRRELLHMARNITDHLGGTSVPTVGRFLKGMAEVMQLGKSEMMLIPPAGPKPSALFLMNLSTSLERFSPMETHLQMEAKVVGRLVLALSSIFEEESIFVVTPHRVQRSLVSKELTSFGLELHGSERAKTKSGRIWVDTTERLQGSEADIVVCVFSHTHLPSLRRDLNFLYSRPRLNVAVSRARLISIVVSSSGVLDPPVDALVTQENLDGFSYLKAYEHRAWKYEQIVDAAILREEHLNKIQGKENDDPTETEIIDHQEDDRGLHLLMRRIHL